jgi:hypothetical protein
VLCKTILSWNKILFDLINTFTIKRESLKQIEKFRIENEKILDFIFLGLIPGVTSVRMNLSY